MDGHFSDDPLQSEDFEDQNFVGLTQLQELVVTLKLNQGEGMEPARMEILAEQSGERGCAATWEDGSWAPVADGGDISIKGCGADKDREGVSGKKAGSTTKGCTKRKKSGSLEEFHDFVLKQDDKVHDALGMLLDYIFDKAKNG